MRKIYKILMLNYGHGLSNREVALIVSVSRSTVADYPLRAQAAGLWQEYKKKHTEGCNTAGFSNSTNDGVARSTR
ncbi:sigma-70 family RNA polymerase sigma factor [Desulfobulbus rhabdoformis]|uniref:sigma-70 family RNA polymerase sigma factor n=1 Tax=Desulfobulbus rhabdoformis TaxID=34032 RepID=UPI0019663F05|nr:sigma-70 family RNA polymerase sigma factor [Desulfobulbus rhabdoformis]